MDISTLNNLLECSICLETIVDSKVLPCQHTFCKKCLEVIVESHKVLCCPECRCKVDIKVEDLPPNVLLMRIIEGIKTTNHQNNTNLNQSVKPSLLSENTCIQQPTRSLQIEQSTTGINVAKNTTIDTTNSNLSKQQLPSPFVHPRIQTSTLQQTSQSSASHNGEGSMVSLSHIKDWRSFPHAKAIFDFNSRESGDLSFKRGDLIILKKRIDHNWSIGECNGSEGAFPINHVQVLVALPVPKCKALYDFQMKPNEEEGCLNFKKGAVIQLIRRVDQNWAEGQLVDVIGIFPISFVEMNLLARQMMDSQIHKSVAPSTNARICPQPPIFEPNLSDSSSTTTSTTSPTTSGDLTTSSNSSTAPNSPITPATKQNSSEPLPPQQQQQQLTNNMMRTREHGKRHSLTALMGGSSHGNVLTASNRHSAEILGIPDLMNLQIGNKDSANTQNPSSEQKSTKSQTHHRTKKFSGGPPPTARELYVALYPYKPQKPDELELKKGFIYYITERCQDGWFKGINQRSQKSGVFPGNYVTPVRSHHHHGSSSSSANENTRKQTHSSVTANSNSASINTTKTSSEIPELPPRNNNNNNNNNSSTSTRSKNSYVDQLFHRKSQSGEKGSKGGDLLSSIAHNSSTIIISAKEKKDSSAKSLMKKLTNMKRSKSPTSATTFDNPSFEDSSLINNKPHSSSAVHSIHVRSGSCPSQLLQSIPIGMNGSGESDNAMQQQHTQTNSQYFGSQRIKQKGERPTMQHLMRHNSHEQTGQRVNNNGCQMSSNNQQLKAMFHRKSQSLDANTIAQQMDGAMAKNKSSNQMRERFRCILEYPPNSEYELGLKVGDIVFVNKRRDNGWMKGTHEKTGKTGLFPASFVEADI